MVMGAHTYRSLAGIVAFAGDADATGARITELPKLVFSHSLRPPLEWANSTVISDDIADAVCRTLNSRTEIRCASSAAPADP
jgi:dihydrofolate reductase